MAEKGSKRLQSSEAVLKAQAELHRHKESLLGEQIRSFANHG
jgi:hypothetical protein